MFDGLVSQDNVKKQLKLLALAYTKLGKRPGDIILSGPSGVGKSTFTREFAKGMDIRYGVKDRKTKEVFSRLAFFELNSQIARNITELFKIINEDYELDCPYENNIYTFPPCIIFIDEAHKMHPTLRTQLLSALDEGRKIDFKVSNFVSTLNFENATIVLATTDLHDLERALINRFELIELKAYSIEDIAQMVVDKKPEWDPNIAYSIGVQIGQRAKTVMRKAVMDLEKLDIFFQVEEIPPSVEATIQYYEEYKEVDEHGLDSVDMDILNILSTGNSGVKSIASRTKKSEREIEERICWMEHIGCAVKAGGGRAITEYGLEKIGKTVSDMPHAPVIANGINVDALIEYYPDGRMIRPTEAFNKKKTERTPEEHALVQEYQRWYRRQREQDKLGAYN